MKICKAVQGIYPTGGGGGGGTTLQVYFVNVMRYIIALRGGGQLLTRNFYFFLYINLDFQSLKYRLEISTRNIHLVTLNFDFNNSKYDFLS